MKPIHASEIERLEKAVVREAMKAQDFRGCSELFLKSGIDAYGLPLYSACARLELARRKRRKSK